MSTPKPEDFGKRMSEVRESIRAVRGGECEARTHAIVGILICLSQSSQAAQDGQPGMAVTFIDMAAQMIFALARDLSIEAGDIKALANASMGDYHDFEAAHGG